MKRSKFTEDKIASARRMDRACVDQGGCGGRLQPVYEALRSDAGSSLAQGCVTYVC